MIYYAFKCPWAQFKLILLWIFTRKLQFGFEAEVNYQHLNQPQFQFILGCENKSYRILENLHGTFSFQILLDPPWFLHDPQMIMGQRNDFNYYLSFDLSVRRNQKQAYSKMRRTKKPKNNSYCWRALFSLGFILVLLIDFFSIGDASTVFNWLHYFN